ncbi:unnamed protein product, partial [Amoebophrya sp. A120]|eukprot:GSA120T00013435001.1
MVQPAGSATNESNNDQEWESTEDEEPAGDQELQPG